MRIRYNLTIDDILALHHYRLQIDKSQRQRYWMRRFLYLFGFTLFALAGFWFTEHVLILYGFSILGIMVFYFYPIFMSWQLRRNLEKTYTDENTRRTLISRVLEISDRGLDLHTAGKENHTGWDDIDDMGVDAAYAFISIGGRSAWIILPAQGIVEGDFKPAVDEIKAYLQSSVAPETLHDKRVGT